MLELKTSYHSGILNIELYGSLDSLTAPDFKFWLTQKSDGGYHYFALNCGGLEFISSRGIGIITELNNILNAADHRLILYHVSNEVLNLLNFLKLSENIPIVDNFVKVKEKFGEKPKQKYHKTEPPKAAPVEYLEEGEEAFSGISSTPASFNTTEKTRKAAETRDHSHAVATDAETETLDEEYIDLSQMEHLKEEYNVAQMNIIFCPNCGQNLRVSKKGLYLCPDCRAKFNYPF
jgi:anti-anti-sigma factor